MAASIPSNANQKTALVVDDSKLARYVLKEMLLGFGINVETAESAEEALGSLSAVGPDVIFMDHMMPGMDGFQAVQAIKSDPKTASIPILMYTSKDEGVYVNQARALGAVGVLPKKLKPVQLEKVLVQLKLVPSPKTEKVTINEDASSAAVHSIKSAETVHAKRSKNTLEELSRSASEEQEKDSMRLLFRQLFSEQRDSIKQDQWQLVSAMADQVTPIVLATRSKAAKWQGVALSALSVCLISLVVVLFGLKETWNLQQQSLNDQINEQGQALKNIQQLIQNTQITQATSVEYVQQELNVKPIEWAINQRSQVSFYQPLNNIHTQNYVTQLIKQLDDFGFTGSIYIQFHSGQFCQEIAEDGVVALVNPQQGLSHCDFTTEGINNSSVLSHFESFLVGLNQDYLGIDIVFESIGGQFTLQDYPETSGNITAGEWNKIAKVNNRFSFVLVAGS